MKTGSLLVALLLGRSALAHPFGPDSIDRLATLEVRPDGVVVRYTLDRAAQTAERELARYQADPKRYAAQQASTLARGLVLAVDSEPLPLSVRTAEARVTLDETGEPGLRLSVELRAKATFGLAPRTLSFLDENYPIFQGRREATIRALPGLVLPDAPPKATSHLKVRVEATPAQTTASGEVVAVFFVTLGLGMRRKK